MLDRQYHNLITGSGLLRIRITRCQEGGHVNAPQP